MFLAELQLNQTLWESRVKKKEFSAQESAEHRNSEGTSGGHDASWEMKSICPTACLSDVGGWRQAEGDGEGGVCHESRKERGRECFLLPLHFINKSFLFQDSCVEANRALLQKGKNAVFPRISNVFLPVFLVINIMMHINDESDQFPISIM